MSTPTPTHRPLHAVPRGLLTGLVLLALAYAWLSLGAIARHAPWYRNADMNIINVVDALCLNSGIAPAIVDQPAAPTKFFLALDYRVRNALGLLPVWHAKRFARSPDPLREYASLVQIGREQSRVLVFALIVLAAGFVGHAARSYEAGCLAALLLSGSSGLLFHGLLVRPELWCVAFGGVLALYAAWLASHARTPAGRARWLLLAGLAVGLGALAKLPGLAYGLLVVAWSALSTLLPPDPASARPAPAPAWRWTIASALAAGIGTLGLLLWLASHAAPLDPVGASRARLTALVVALLPLAGLMPVRSRLSEYARGRLLDLALLLAGALLSLGLWFALVRITLPAPAAADYLTKILNAVFYPDLLLKIFTQPGEVHRLHEMGRFFLETPALFASTTALVLALLFWPGVPRRTQALVLVLFLQALGVVALLSQREFLDHFSLFAQVPLLLCWPIALTAWHRIWCAHQPVTEHRWPGLLALTAAGLLALLHPVELRFKYHRYQAEPVGSVDVATITFLYDHPDHPAPFVAALKARYPTREAFTAALHEFLREPARHP